MNVPLASIAARPIPRPADDAPHILLVDDDRRIRDLLSRFLRGEGYRVTTAASASDARAKLAGLQTTRINKALAEMGPQDGETLKRFLRAMIDRDDPDKVLETIFSSDNQTAKE